MSVSAEVEAYIKETGQGTKGWYGDRTKCTEEGMFHPGEPRSRSRFFFSGVMIITNGGPCGAELELRSLTAAWVRTPGLAMHNGYTDLNGVRHRHGGDYNPPW